MAHFSPKVAQTKRHMAHPVRPNPLRSIGRAFGALAARLGGLGSSGPTTRSLGEPGPDGPAARSLGEPGSNRPATLSPGRAAAIGPATRAPGRAGHRTQRRRELVAVLALLVAAAAVSASLPGGWADTPPSATPSASPSAELVAGLTSADPTLASEALPSAASEEPAMPSPSATPLPSPTKKPTAAPAKKPAPKTYTFVALGDSLTAWPTDGPWPVLLDAKDANLRLVHNAGVPGNLTADMRARLNSDVFAYSPNVLFIMGGTNDVGQRVSQATTIANLRAIIVAATAKKIRVFLMTIPPDAYPGMAADINSLNAAITHLGNTYKLTVIDVHAALSTSTGVYVKKFTSDGLHFSALGAQTVANTVYSRVHRLGY